MVYYSEADAVAAIEAMGAQARVAENGERYWALRGKVDDWYGGYESVAILRVQHHRVAPQYNAPDYYEIKFS